MDNGYLKIIVIETLFNEKENLTKINILDVNSINVNDAIVFT